MTKRTVASEVCNELHLRCYFWLPFGNNNCKSNFVSMTTIAFSPDFNSFLDEVPAKIGRLTLSFSVCVCVLVYGRTCTREDARFGKLQN